jgi:uncharacterized protein (TIGR02246 family)
MFFWSHVAIVAALAGSIYAASPGEDESAIRTMVDQAVKRLNNGDLTALEYFWAEDADYVGVDGKLIRGRTQIQALFRAAAGKTGQQTAAIEQIRFITREIATVDGTWTVTGVRDATGQELPPIKGRGFEVVQKKSGRWRFVLTREMVIFGGK